MFAEVETYQEDELLLRGDRAKESEGRADIQIRPSSVSSPFSTLYKVILPPTSEFYLGEPQNYSFICIYFYFMYVLPKCMCLPCVCSTLRGQKGASDPLELESQMDLRLHVDAGSRARVFCKSSKCCSLP